MTKKRCNRKSSHPKGLLLITTAILLSAIVAVAIYVNHFGTVLSNDSNRWGEFGSYIGGIFSPLVAFAALLALLNSIHLQRKFLEQQITEFKEIHSQQQSQLTTAQDALRIDKIFSQKSITLQTLNQLINFYQTENNNLKTFINGMYAENTNDLTKIIELTQKSDVIMKKYAHYMMHVLNLQPLITTPQKLLLII